MFSEKLKQIRKSRNLTQQKLADLIGVGTNTIGRLEIDTYPPSYPTLKKLVEKAGVKLSELF